MDGTKRYNEISFLISLYLLVPSIRYNEIRKLIPTITERTLSLQLKQLEEDGIIERKVYTQKPPLMVEYALTDFGKTLFPVIQAITKWGIEAAENSKKIIRKMS